MFISVYATHGMMAQLEGERRRGRKGRKEGRGGSVWEMHVLSGCNQGEMLHVAVVIQACIHVAVVIHTCLLLPSAMTLRDRKVRGSRTIIRSNVGDRIITLTLYVLLYGRATIATWTPLWGSQTEDLQINTQK